jgi:hypothetical protein
MQIVAVAGGANITLWDAYSGTFLGILGSFGQLLDIPGEINPSEGLPLEPVSRRAASCPAGAGQLPPLGTEFVDMIPPEDTTLGSKVNAAANVASSVASTFAKKCASTASLLKPLTGRCVARESCLNTAHVHELHACPLGVQIPQIRHGNAWTCRRSCSTSPHTPLRILLHCTCRPRLFCTDS